jgi:hypothetical protein
MLVGCVHCHCLYPYQPRRHRQGDFFLYCLNLTQQIPVTRGGTSPANRFAIRKQKKEWPQPGAKALVVWGPHPWECLLMALFSLVLRASLLTADTFMWQKSGCWLGIPIFLPAPYFSGPTATLLGMIEGQSESES